MAQTTPTITELLDRVAEKMAVQGVLEKQSWDAHVAASKGSDELRALRELLQQEIDAQVSQRMAAAMDRGH